MLGLSHFTRQDFPFNIGDGFLFGHAKVISGLQVKPELRASAEITGKPQGGIGGDAALFPHDVIDAWGWNLQSHCQGIGRHSQRVQVFLTQYFAGMDRTQRVTRDNVAKVGMVKVLGAYGRHGLASRVIHYFNIVCVAVFKPKTQTPFMPCGYWSWRFIDDHNINWDYVRNDWLERWKMVKHMIVQRDYSLVPTRPDKTG